MATQQPPDSPNWRQPVAVAAACAVIGLLTRVVAGGVPAPVAMIGLGAGLLGASLLLSWAADAAEVDVSGGMVVAGITLVTVLPELIIEVHFAYTQ
jgi:cation:H+ antiporter